MKFEFTFTLENLIELTLRSARKHPEYRQAAIRNALLWGLINVARVYTGIRRVMEQQTDLT
jgi:hypothetical protein